MSFRSSYIEEILNVAEYGSDIMKFNAIFCDLKNIFREKVPCREGVFSALEISREYLTVMSKMAWRLSVLTFEVAKAQVPELIVFKTNVVTLLNNINVVEQRLREILLAESLWTLKYKGMVSPNVTSYEIYYSKALKSALDRIYMQTNNLIHTAISLGSIYKVRLSIVDKQMQQPMYEPKLIPSEIAALKTIQKTGDKKTGEE